MPRQRFRRKDLRRPDEFVSQGRALVDWARENVRTLSWAVGGVVALVLVILGVFSLRSARLRQANEDLARALAEFRAGQYSQAATQFADIASRWQSTAAGRMAGLYAASADLKASNPDAAVTMLQEALNAAEWPPYLRQQALLELALALEHKGDMQNAAARYAEAASAEGPYTALAILGEARTREQAGEKDKARELYERFAREFPQAPETELVAEKLQLLTPS